MRKNKLLTIWAVLVFAFLAIPLLIITVTAFGGGSAITFPIESFSLKWFANVFALKSFRRSFITSLEVAFLATFISLLVGIPAAYALARSGHERERTFKIHFPVTYHCARYRYRLYHVPVPDINFKDPCIYRTFGRSFHGNTAICDPCGRFFHGAV